jgi:hypothetical protein
VLAAKNGVGLMLLERYFIDIYYIMGGKKNENKSFDCVCYTNYVGFGNSNSGAVTRN